MATGPTRAIGSLIGNRYEVRGYLGSGGYGEVYRVHDRHQNQVVAAKLLRSIPGATWDEAQMLTGLRSEYILPVLNADFDVGVPFLVTELALYGTTDAHMSPTGVPPDLAVRWVRHACRGAARTHQAGLVHRDIKPQNLFLTAASEAVLGDFGLAGAIGPTGVAGPHGTPCTIAPEAVPGGFTSALSDVYSLGATLYALLAGRYAHAHPDPAQNYALVLNTPIPPLRDYAPHVSRALNQRIMRAMARNPTDRYQSAAEFDAELGALPIPMRYWRRTDQHAAAGHACCWLGTSAGKADVGICLIPVGSRFEVVAQHEQSGRRIIAACRPAAPPSAAARNLRAAMSNVD